MFRALRSSPHSPPQFVERDRQIAHALAGRVIDRVGDRRRHADDADLAQPLMPSGLTMSSGSSTKMTSMSWTSAFTGT